MSPRVIPMTHQGTEGVPNQDSEELEELLRVEGLKVHFPIKSTALRRPIGVIPAVDGVDISVLQGDTLGLVGESGSGKSTVARAILRLIEPTAGRVLFRGHDLTALSRKDLRPFRRQMQIVLQDPFSSLNPRKTVGAIVAEPLQVHREGSRRDQRLRVHELLELVGLQPEHASRFPHEFSGGQRQRIGIARALALNPELLVLDEPVSALDVSTQAQVINLLDRLQDELSLTYILIAHDLSVVKHICDRVAVMYLGRVVEEGTCKQVYERTAHPYTKSLLSAIPVPDPALRGQRQRIVLQGEAPSPRDPPSGCRFRTRCWKAQPLCADETPELAVRGVKRHPSACHFPE